jgi:hypothetical protein
MLADIGRIVGNLSDSVAGRGVRSNADHLVVLNTRIGLAVAVGAVAVLGAWRRWRKGFDDRVALVLLVTPFTAMALQSYGGEMALRVYFFALPAACLLVAYAVFPEFPGTTPAPRRAMALVLAALCAPVLVGGFLVARYGNEALEHVREGEVAAIEHLLGTTTGPIEVLWPAARPADSANAAMVHGFADMERVTFRPTLAPIDPEDPSAVVGEVAGAGPDTYFLTTRSQEAELELIEGYPSGWGDEFRARMSDSRDLRVVLTNDDAVVWAARAPDRVAEVPAATVLTVPMGWTPLTPVGLACLVPLVGVLLVREVRRQRSPPGRPRDLRSLTLVALPLAVGFFVVVAERFAVLA